MNNKTLLRKATDLAIIAHNNQVDKAGKPYILHPLRVMQACIPDYKAMIVAILHDVLEDAPALTEKVYKLLPTPLYEALSHITRLADEKYKEYIYRVSLNEIAAYVKIQDLRDNMDLRRINGVTKKDIRRTVKYAEALAYLLGVK